MPKENVDMPYLHPRRRWRSALASAVSAATAGAVAGCGEPSHAEDGANLINNTIAYHTSGGTALR
jgi:hypothetical protein